MAFPFGATEAFLRLMINGNPVGSGFSGDGDQERRLIQSLDGMNYTGVQDHHLALLKFQSTLIHIDANASTQHMDRYPASIWFRSAFSSPNRYSTGPGEISMSMVEISPAVRIS